MSLPPDLLYFLIVVILMFVVGIPLIKKNVSLPAALHFEEVPRESLSAAQAEFFRGNDEKLNPLGFHPFSTFRVVNLSGGNLSRAYANSSDPAQILVTLMTSSQGTVAHNYVEINSKYQDGWKLTTKNSNLSSVFDRARDHVVQPFPGISDLEKLKERHDAKAAYLISHGPIYRRTENFFNEFQDYHHRFCELQQSKRLLRLDPTGTLYRTTAWTGLRGIRNFLNPLADTFTVPRFLAGVLFGGVLPLVAILQPAILMDWLKVHIALDPESLGWTVRAVAYTLGGCAVGYIFKQKSFLWAFLLGSFPVLIVENHTNSVIGSCLWMGTVAHITARLRSQRERLV